MDTFGESAIAHLDDDFSKASTNLPEIIVEEEAAISTMVIIVISAILSITLLFVMAVFIDCRHQKLDKIKQQRSPKKILRISIPHFIRNKDTSEDEESFADKMCTEDSMPSSASVIV